MLDVIVVTAAGGPPGTAVVRELRPLGLPLRAVVNRRRPELIGALLGRPPRTLAEHLADLPLRDAA